MSDISNVIKRTKVISEAVELAAEDIYYYLKSKDDEKIMSSDIVKIYEKKYNSFIAYQSLIHLNELGIIKIDRVPTRPGEPPTLRTCVWLT